MHRTETEEASNKGPSPRGRAILSRRLRDGVLLVRSVFTLELYSTFRTEHRSSAACPHHDIC